MKTGLLLSVAFLFCGEANAACTSSPDCDTLGYKYSVSDCPNGGVKCPFDTSKYFCFSPESACSYPYTAYDCAAECKNVGSLTCSRNGTTYYASCGSSKCSSGQTCINGVCKSKEPECNYYLTEEDCAKECKSVGSLSCQKNGKTYYSFCGVSKCSASQTCNYNYGICENKKEECTYTFTEEDCAKQCKKVGYTSCTREGVTYYSDCGIDTCYGDKICNNGKCQSVNYFNCCDTGQCTSDREFCLQHYGDCSTMKSSCAGTTSFIECTDYVNGYDYGGLAKWSCLE